MHAFFLLPLPLKHICEKLECGIASRNTLRPSPIYRYGIRMELAICGSMQKRQELESTSATSWRTPNFRWDKIECVAYHNNECGGSSFVLWEQRNDRRECIFYRQHYLIA